MNFGWIAENWCRDFQGTPEWIENQHPTHEGLISWYHVKISSIIATTKGWQFFDKKLVEVGWFGSFGGLKCLSGTFFEKKNTYKKSANFSSWLTFLPWSPRIIPGIGIVVIGFTHPLKSCHGVSEFGHLEVLIVPPFQVLGTKTITMVI